MTSLTLERWLEREAVPAPLATLFKAVAASAVEIAAALRRAAVAGETGAVGSVNVQGEEQKALDVLANDIFLAQGARTGVLAAMVSEELDDISLVEGAGPEARYALVFDPLDGSSNLEVNGAVGSIFSVLDLGKSEGVTASDVLQPGHRQVAAGYVLYGPATILVLTAGDGVAMFSLDADSAGPEMHFRLTNPSLTVQPSTAEYAINASRYPLWYPPTRAYIEGCLAGRDGPFGKRYNMRWCAAMVADLHRILCRGGIFLYPEDVETKGKGGRLRLLYEAAPMALIVEAAGGRASTGTERILDVQPTALHQRIGVVIGSAEEVERVEALHRAEHA